MPIIDQMGRSEITEIKQEHFRVILRAHLRIVKAIFDKYQYKLPTYFYFDINAGSGSYEGKSGSPLIFLEEVTQIDIPYSAIFIDKDEKNIETLSVLTKPYQPNVKTFCGEHADILPKLYAKDCQQRYGLLYTDPNGIFDAEILREFSQNRCYQKLDILINCPAVAIKRMKNSPKHLDKRTLEERLQFIPKKYWLIRNALKNNSWQWTFLLGTNWTDFPEFKKIDMVKLDSSKGQAFFEKLNLTSKERQEFYQPGLFNSDISNDEDDN